MTVLANSRQLHGYATTIYFDNFYFQGYNAFDGNKNAIFEQLNGILKGEVIKQKLFRI